MKPGHYKMKRLSLSLCSADSRLNIIFELFCQIIQNAKYGLRSAWKSLFFCGWLGGRGGGILKTMQTMHYIQTLPTLVPPIRWPEDQ